MAKKRLSEHSPREYRIVYEDDDVLVVDKAPGALTATPPGSRDDSVFSILKRRARAQSRREEHRVYIIHRLDRDASGLLVFAKSERAFGWLKEDFRARRVTRSYVAVADGDVTSGDDLAKSGTLQSFLREDRNGHVVSVPAPRVAASRSEHEDDDTPGTPKLAVTHYEVLHQGRGRTLVKLRMETGRKHQIRVQMADMGHPLAGDVRYGGRTDGVHRLALHAVELAFRHPGTGRTMAFASSPPDVFFRAVGAKTFPVVPIAADEMSAEPRRGADRMDTSWDRVAPWYDELIDDRNHDHHEEVIVPGTMSLLGDVKGRVVLDLACGQGAFSRRLASNGATVIGVDASARLIETARRIAVPPIRYEIGDARDLKSLGLPPIDVITCVMALMNIDPLDPVFKGCAALLKPGGRLVFVILHPAFRAPKQTSWGSETESGRFRQFRRVDGYLSTGSYDITMNPGEASGGAERVVTWTFHRPLQTYIKALESAGFLLESLEEWPSMRLSQRSARSAEENRIRREIPLFLAVRARRVQTEER